MQRWTMLPPAPCLMDPPTHKRQRTHSGSSCYFLAKNGHTALLWIVVGCCLTPTHLTFTRFLAVGFCWELASPLHDCGFPLP